jgi:hypothetical protein
MRTKAHRDLRKKDKNEEMKDENEQIKMNWRWAQKY